MYSFKHIKDIATDDEMIAFLKGLQPISPQGPIAIVGGHFMLFYDKDEDCLKPLIHQDLIDDNHVAFAKLMAGDFPVRTFDYSVELIKHYRNKGVNAGNVFIINDHKFQSSDFQPSILDLVKNRGGELRSQFYRGKHAFPKAFQKIVEKNGYAIARDVVFDNDDSGRNKKSILPRKTVFYSEQFLRRQFDRNRKKQIMNEKFFFEKKTGSINELYFGDNQKEICLTFEGSCGCSLEVMEFIWKLMERNFNTIIMFIPNECESHVNNGVELSLRFIKENFKEDLKVYVVTGLGGIAANINSSKINLFEHQISLKKAKLFSNV